MKQRQSNEYTHLKNLFIPFNSLILRRPHTNMKRDENKEIKKGLFVVYEFFISRRCRCPQLKLSPCALSITSVKDGHIAPRTP